MVWNKFEVIDIGNPFYSGLKKIIKNSKIKINASNKGIL